MYWRFYPLGEKDALKTAGDIVRLIECTPDEERQMLPGDANPFTYLQSPLQSAIDQLGEEYKQHVAERTQDTFTRKLTSLLERDDVMEADGTLWTKLHRWRQDPPPVESLSRGRVRDVVRVLRQTPATADAPIIVERLKTFWSGLEAEGLDRPFPKPVSREPTVRDLQLVCWELVVTQTILDELMNSGQ